MDHLIEFLKTIFVAMLGYFAHFFQQKFSKEEEHDKKIFTEEEKILTEENLFVFMNDLFNGGKYWQNQAQMFYLYFQYIDDSGNIYLKKSIQKKRESFINHCRTLYNTVLTHYFVIEGLERDSKYGARMQLGPDYPESRRDQVIRFLNEQIQSVQKSYLDYRKEIKQRLYI